MFPLAAWAFLSHAHIAVRCVSLGASILLVILLPSHLTILGLVWLAGAAAYWLNGLFRMKGVLASRWYAALTFVVVTVVWS